MADYITAHIERLGGVLRIPPTTLARLLIVTNEGITISGYVDGEDLYRPYLEMIMANVAPVPVAQPSRGRLKPAQPS